MFLLSDYQGSADLNVASDIFDCFLMPLCFGLMALFFFFFIVVVFINFYDISWKADVAFSKS